MKTRLESYGFSKTVVITVEPIIEAIGRNDIKKAEQLLSKLCMDVCDKVEKDCLSPRDGDNYFTLIDLYITDNWPDLKLRKEVEDIFTEGMLLHDYGNEYGANLNNIRKLALMLQE